MYKRWDKRGNFHVYIVENKVPAHSLPRECQTNVSINLIFNLILVQCLNFEACSVEPSSGSNYVCSFPSVWRCTRRTGLLPFDYQTWDTSLCRLVWKPDKWGHNTLWVRVYSYKEHNTKSHVLESTELSSTLLNTGNYVRSWSIWKHKRSLHL